MGSEPVVQSLFSNLYIIIVGSSIGLESGHLEFVGYLSKEHFKHLLVLEVDAMGFWECCITVTFSFISFLQFHGANVVLFFSGLDCYVVA